MLSLNMVEETLPPGFRFHPTDDELICDYLLKMIAGCDPHPILIVVDLNKSEPWDIPKIACVGGKDYYFYSQRDKKYATGLRTNRATISGYWKATGKDRAVLRKGTLVGMRKTLVFYQGRAPKGRKTDWVMHEFRLEGPLGSPKLSPSKEDWVLCRVFFKNSRDVGGNNKLQEVDYTTGEENSPSSSSLPPLMDPYLTFGQTQNDEHEQVPCFSIFAADQATHNINPFSYLSSSTHHGMECPSFSTSSLAAKNLPSFGGPAADLHHFGSYLNTITTPTATTSSSSCEEKVLKAVLNQLTRTGSGANHNNINIQGGTSPSFGEASTSDSFLSEAALSTMWN